jgi:putative transposase
VQRGNDRQPCFFRDEDYLRYLSELAELALRRNCAVHAYVLMTNHVHLLVTPSAVGQMGSLIQALGRRYVRYVNDRYHRSGTLWEGRYRSCLVDHNSYLLHCYRYIELNPVRARMVDDPAGYRWSSYGANGLGQHDALVTPHANFLAIDRDPARRQVAYRELVRQTVSDDELTAIRLHPQRQHALVTVE